MGWGPADEDGGWEALNSGRPVRVRGGCCWRPRGLEAMEESISRDPCSLIAVDGWADGPQGLER